MPTEAMTFYPDDHARVAESLDRYIQQLQAVQSAVGAVWRALDRRGWSAYHVDHLLSGMEVELQRVVSEQQHLRSELLARLPLASEVSTASPPLPPSLLAPLAVALAPTPLLVPLLGLAGPSVADLAALLKKYGLDLVGEVEFTAGGKHTPLRLGIAKQWDLYTKTLREQEGTIGSVPLHEQVDVALGHTEGAAGIGLDSHGHAYAGLWGSVTLAQLEETDRLGDTNLALTNDSTITLGKAEAEAGFHDGSVGFEAGFTYASVKEEIGTNIAGYNVGVNAEVGLKAELGLEIGAKTELKLPFITIGFSFGGAK